jgi:hypothetical protein
VGAVVGEGELAELFHVSDLSGQPGGAIDYEEFLAGVFGKSELTGFATCRVW